MIGGLIYSVTGRPWPVYACAVAAYLTALGTLLGGARHPASSDRAPVAPLPGIVLEGIRYIWHNKLILGTISLDLFAVFSAAPWP